MHCIKEITKDLIWVGANDRRLSLFEGVYSVPDGVSYNSYLLMDEKAVLVDTVDKAVSHRFSENVSYILNGKPLDYIVVQHMEPDHSAALIDMLKSHPDAKVVCNKKTLDMMGQFFNYDFEGRIHLVAEGDTLNTGKHSLKFLMAPMVHWPEVMVTYDESTNTLFSADAFGCFGALNGAIFADEVDFMRDYLDETRRYYANIVGKYGQQVQTLLSKLSNLKIEMICPLHGFVWRKHLDDIISKYNLWGRYEPEEYGVMIAYASVYGNTENAAEALACRLRDKGIKTVMFDVSVYPASDIVSAAFKWSHLVFASTTYNAGIFVTMESLIYDLAAHNIQNRTIAIIENGSWAATSGKLIQEKLGLCKNISFLDKKISIKSSVKENQLNEIEEVASAIALSLQGPVKNVSTSSNTKPENKIDQSSLFNLSYGLFVLTAKDGDKDNGCIINTVTQITQSPLRITIAVNKANYTHDMIIKTGVFNVSILTEQAEFKIFEHFGFQSGRDTDKFPGISIAGRAANGVAYLTQHTNSVISANVIQSYDYGTHTLFVADITEAFKLSDEKSLTYQYYFDHIKPKPKPQKDKKVGYICKICGYIYEGEP
ncbi:MAG: flavin reductase, partial [Clostridiales bacterium]|nr:flavin reductase [Clostridiales bacterium]